MSVDGDLIATTGNHRFWNVTDRAWEPAEDLVAGDEVLGADGRPSQVEGLESPEPRDDEAYNLTVEGVHTYHVGRLSILVHNICNPNWMRQEILRGQGPRGIKRVDPAHVDAPGAQPHITFRDDLPTLNLDGTWGHLGRNGGRVPSITNRQRAWLERHEWPVPD